MHKSEVFLKVLLLTLIHVLEIGCSGSEPWFGFLENKPKTLQVEQSNDVNAELLKTEGENYSKKLVKDFLNSFSWFSIVIEVHVWFSRHYSATCHFGEERQVMCFTY